MTNLTLTIHFCDISQSFVSATKYENTSNKLSSGRITDKSTIEGTPDNERSTLKRVRQRRKYFTVSLSLFMRLTQKLLRSAIGWVPSRYE
jgi:hypothetical protein